MVTSLATRRRGARAVLAAPAVAVVGVSALVVGCSSGATSTPSTRSSVDNPTVVVPSFTTRSATPAPVHVRASVAVPSSRAVTALLTFVKGHAESVDSGRVTTLLTGVTTSAELSRQRQVVAFAVAKGYAVPREPLVRVVSVVDRSTTLERLAVCFWLPSTEYVDATTGRPPNGTVPNIWATAVATLRLANVTWSVDNLTQPDETTTIRCGGTP